MNRNVILLGMPGTGKSSIANSIAGRKGIFEVKARSRTSVTQKPTVRSSVQPRYGKAYKVCDNPGLLDNDMGLLERVLQVQDSLKECPKPHAFLIVFSIADREHRAENFLIDLIRIMFGEDVFKHCIIVFTRGDDIANNDEFESFCNESKLIVDLKERCGNRIVKIENKFDKDGAPIGNGVDELLRLIEEVSDNGKCVYDKGLRMRRKAIKKHNESFEETSENIAKKLDDIATTLETYVRYLETGVKTVSTVGVVVVGGLVVAKGGAVVEMVKGGGVAVAGGIKVVGGKVAAAVVDNAGPTINVAMNFAFKTT